MPAIVVTDALGRELRLTRPARRVVSLVPSETESVAELRGLDVLVGRTDYCEEPRGAIDHVPSVGGTKKFDLETVRALAPDLVLANQEENARAAIERLIEDGLPVYVSFPRTVWDVIAHLEVLGRMLGVAPDLAPIARARDAVKEASARARSPRSVFVPIWMDPLMTFDGRTYASDLLALAGATNVFADRPRRYPLAADLGALAPLPEPAIVGRDTRYPRIPFEEIVARAPQAILLPDEPHRFTEADAERFRALDVPAARTNAIAFVSGKDLFWSSTRLPSALDRLIALLMGLQVEPGPW